MARDLRENRLDSPLIRLGPIKAAFTAHLRFPRPAGVIEITPPTPILRSSNGFRFSLAKDVSVMPLMTTKPMFDLAYTGGFAVGAFNVNNMEITQSIIDACAKENSPCILQISKGARKYANMR